ncbi:MAG: peptide deformylase [Acidimicrobiia bacterium]|nr:peptide deformylase [Acidimicrobiia bacterium]
MIRSIPQLGDPVLRATNTTVSPEQLASNEIQQLIDDMIDTMRDAKGAGIAANQVGVNLRICVIGVDHNARYPYKPPIPLTVLVNPTIEPLDAITYLNNEGCLSVPIRGDLHRYMSIRVTALDRHGAPIDGIYRGLSAGTVQHEVDHLDSKLIVDRIHDPLSMSTWANFAQFGYDEYIRRVQPVIDVTEPQVETSDHD